MLTGSVRELYIDWSLLRPKQVAFDPSEGLPVVFLSFFSKLIFIVWITHHRQNGFKLWNGLGVLRSSYCGLGISVVLKEVTLRRRKNKNWTEALACKLACLFACLLKKRWFLLRVPIPLGPLLNRRSCMSIRSDSLLCKQLIHRVIDYVYPCRYLLPAVIPGSLQML